MDSSDSPAKMLADAFCAHAEAIKGQIESTIDSLMSRHRVEFSELKDALRKIYWSDVDVPLEWLKSAFMVLGDRDFREAFQNKEVFFACNNCQCPLSVTVRDREDRGRFSRMILVCPDCTQQITDDHRKKAMEEELADNAKAREREIAELRAMPYEEYLQSAHWQAIREEALVRDDRRCQVCEAQERLQVHHSTYDRRGDEDLHDLLTLCADCHQLFHDHRKLTRPA